LFRKEIYLPFLLSILLFLSIDISFYNYIALGKEDDSKDNVKEEGKEEGDDNRDNKDNVKEEGKEEGDDNRDNKDNVKEEGKEEKEAEDEVPFLLPFNAVPFP
jgi:hypothetical protein